VLRITYERLRRPLSQEKLGVMVRLRQPDIGLIEHGRLIPTPQRMAQFDAIFGIPGDFLLRPVKIIEEEKHQPSTRPRNATGQYVPLSEAGQ
jgi:ribosome-binding protein aMBF1 (putative translation factor)